MKLSKEDLKKEIAELVENEDAQIKLLEDVEDSFEVVESEQNDEIESLKKDLLARDDEIAELKRKYKERFLKGEEVEVAEEKTEDATEDITEEVVEEPRKYEDLFDEEGELK